MWDQRDLKFCQFKRSCHRVTSSSCCPQHEIRSVLSIPIPDMIIVEILEDIMMAEEVSDMTAEEWDCWDVKYQQRQACWALKHSENWEAKTKRAGHWSMNGGKGVPTDMDTVLLVTMTLYTQANVFCLVRMELCKQLCRSWLLQRGKYGHCTHAVVWTSHQLLILSYAEWPCMWNPKNQLNYGELEFTDLWKQNLF